MGFKPRPPPPPTARTGNIKRGFADKRVSSSPGLLRKKGSVRSKEPETMKKSNSWWNLEGAQDNTGRRNSRAVRSSKLTTSSVPQSPSIGSRKSSSSAKTPPSTMPVNSTRKIQFRHKVSCKGQVLYEWEQNPKFVTIYYPTPDADFKAFCNIAGEHVQLGTKPKGLPTKWFLSHDTGGQVDVEGSDWKQCKQHCRIILKKVNKGATWARALRDDRVDQTTTIKKSRAKMDRAESEPALSPNGNSSTKKKWKNGSKCSTSNQSDDDYEDDSEIGSEELDGSETNAQRLSSQGSMSRNSAASEEQERPKNRRSDSQDGRSRRSESQSSKKQQRRMSKKQPRRTRSSCSAPSEKPMSTIFVEEEESPKMSPKRRSASQSNQPKKSGAVRRTKSSRSVDDKPMSTIFVEEEEAPKIPPPRKSRTAARRMSARSCDSIDEELPFTNIEVDRNSDLISVL